MSHIEVRNAGTRRAAVVVVLTDRQDTEDVAMAFPSSDGSVEDQQ